MKGVPTFNNSFFATSLIIIDAIKYHADNAHNINSYPAITLKNGYPKCPITSNMNPINSNENIVNIALCMNNEPTQNIAVNNVNPSK